jgi:hypothetical protein
MPLTDFLGQEINVGDGVIYPIAPGGTTEMVFGEVLDIKGKWKEKFDGGYMVYKVQIQPRDRSRSGTWFFDKPNPVWITNAENVVKVGA